MDTGTSGAAVEVIEDVAAAGEKLFSEPVMLAGMKLAFTAAILIIGYIIIRILLGITERALQKTRLDAVLHTFFINCAKVVMWVILLVTALNYLGIPPTSLLTVLGAAGVAVALALKDSLGNFAGGILIIISKPFSKGDFIEDLEISGKVETIDLLYTTLKTYDNKVITIPNGKLANSTIVNYTKEKCRRVDFTFQIGMEDDMARAKDILAVISESDARIYKEPVPIMGMASMSAGSVILDFKVWCDTEDYWDVWYYVQEQAKVAFDEAGITLPFARMDVHLKK